LNSGLGGPGPETGSGPAPARNRRAAAALDLLREGRFGSAARAFEAALAVRVARPGWWLRRAAEARAAAGLALFHAGDLAGARDELGRALGHAPDVPAAGEYLARIHLRSGRAREALEALAMSSGADATLEGALVHAVSLAQLGEAGPAARAMDDALALGLERPLGSRSDPPRPAETPWIGGGAVPYADQRCRLAARMAGAQPREAAAHLEAAVETNPRYLRARVALALLSLQHGQVPRAVALLEGARALEPGYPDVLAWLGLARLRSGDAHGAIRALHDALERQREFGRAHRFLALTLHALGREREALAAARCGLVLERDVPALPGRPGVPGLEAEGASEGQLERALAIRPHCADFHLALGHRRASRGAFHQARQAIGQALALQPDFSAARVDLARVELSLGRVAEAEAHLDRASRRQPGWVDVLALLGRTRLLLGRTREAVLPLRAALRQCPTFAAARLDLEAALQNLGRLERGRVAAWWEPSPAPKGAAQARLPDQALARAGV